MGICAVPTASAVATGKVSCYTCIIPLHTPQLYRDDQPGVVTTCGLRGCSIITIDCPICCRSLSGPRQLCAVSEGSTAMEPPPAANAGGDPPV